MDHDPRWKLALLTTMLICLFLFGCRHASAGSIAQEHLSSIRAVRIDFPTGGLRYDPVQGLDLEILRLKAISTIEEALRSNGVEVDPNSDQELLVSVTYLHDWSCEGQHVFEADLELRETAILSRSWSKNLKEQVWITSWRDSTLITGPVTSVVDQLVEALERSATAFAQKVDQAKYYNHSKDEGSADGSENP